MSNRYEQQFLDALKDIFIGAKVEGESGYINLMKIKARYFSEGVFPRLMQDIETVCQPFAPPFREELFDKLYDFFQRYFSESGSIYFRHTALHHNVYEKVYTDDRDVMLFWKTHMLYYVKTDRLFQSMAVEVEGKSFYFDVSKLEHKRANEKRALLYELKGVKDGTIQLAVTYTEKGRVTKTDEILRTLKQKGINLDEETLARATRLFEKQSEVDYFINKNAQAFLQEQFDLWLYQYVFSGESAWTETRLQQLQAIKTIAYHIITFIAQFEDELVRVWQKPRFVLHSHYILTLDKITDADLLSRLLAHPGLTAQVQEWRDLGMLDDETSLAEMIQAKDLTSAPRYPALQYLPLDTRHFPDLELDILAQFDDLDAALDGWLIHSENYQALNTILPKFQGKVHCVYIDPPYNTGSDEFIYNDRFRHAAWLSMMENRLSLSRDLLKNDAGSIFISIDDNAQAMLKNLGDLTFGNNNFVTNIIWQKKYSPQNDARYFSDNHDYLTVFAKNKDKWKRNLLPRSPEVEKRYSNPDNDPRGPWKASDFSVKTYSSEYDYPITIPSGRVINPPQSRCWSTSRAGLENLIKDNRIWFGPRGDNVPALKRFLSEVQLGMVPLTIWTYKEVGHNQEAKQEFKTIIGEQEDTFSTPKPVRLLNRILQIGTSQLSIVLDFFGGSGTTAHAVMNLNREDGGQRKYILVEMGEHFTTVILPRIKKVAFSDKWKDGQANGGQGMSHFVKYYDLEQYEDTLRRAHYEDAPLLARTGDAYSSYVFLRDRKLLDAITLDKEANQIHVHLEQLYSGIDLAETLSHITGKGIRRITPEQVIFQDGTAASLTHPDWTLIKPLIWW